MVALDLSLENRAISISVLDMMLVKPVLMSAAASLPAGIVVSANPLAWTDPRFLPLVHRRCRIMFQPRIIRLGL